MANVENVVVTKFRADITDLQSGLKQVQGQLGQVSGAAGGINKTGFAMTALGTAAGVAGAMLVSKVIQPLTALPALGVKLAAQYEQTQIAFTTMLGSAQEANQFLDELKDFAARTPFELDGLLESAKMMQAFGFEAQEVIPTLESVGDASAALGLGTEGVRRITLALGQMKAMGRVLTQDLKQLQFAGVPAVQMLADSFGKTVPEMQKMISAGEVASDVAIPMLIKAMQEGTENTKGFGGMMEAQSKTFSGVMSTFKDEAQFALVDGVLPALKMATAALKEMTPIIRPLVGVIGTLIGQGFQLLATAVLSVVRPVISLMELMDGLRNGTQRLSEPVMTLMATFKGLAEMLRTNLARAVETIRQAFDEYIRPAINKLFNVIQNHIPTLTRLANAFGFVANILTRYVLPIFLKISGWFLGNLIQGIAAAVDGLLRFADAAIDTVLDIINTFVKGYNLLVPVINGVLRATNNADKQISQIGSVTLPDLSKGFNQSAEAARASSREVAQMSNRVQGLGAAANGVRPELDETGTAVEELGTKSGKTKEKIEKLTQGMRTTLQSVISFNAGASGLFRTLGGDALARFSQKLLNAGKITDDLKDEFKELADVVKENVTRALDDANDKLAKQQALYDGVFTTVRDGITGSFSLGEAYDNATRSSDAVSEALIKQAEAQRAVNEAITQGDEDALAKANKDLDEANDQLSSARKNQKGFLDFLKIGADQAVTFANQIDALRLAGGSLALVQEISKLGAQRGLAAVEELLRGGAAAIAEANNLIAAVETAARKVAEATAEQFYGAGVRAALEYVNALRDVLIPQLQAVLNEIAAMMKQKAPQLPGMEMPTPGPQPEPQKTLVGNKVQYVDTKGNVVATLTKQPNVTNAFIPGLGLTPMATGGIVTKPMAALVGEAGPEAIIPLSQAGGMMGGVLTYNINVNVPVSSNAAEVGRQVVDAITAFERRNGRVYEPA